MTPAVRREQPASGERASARARRVAWRQVGPGAVLLALLLFFAAAVFFLDEVRRELSEGAHLVVTAPSARGLELGSDVWVAGIPAGRIEAIHLRGTDRAGLPVLIEAVLSRGASRVLRADASASLRESSLLAPVVLSVDPGREANRPFDFSDTLRARQEADLDATMARADSLMARLRRLAPEGRAVARRLEDGPGTLAALRRHPAELARLRRDLRRTRRLALSSRGGTALRLARDSALRAEGRRVRRRLSAMLSPDGSLARARRERAILSLAADSVMRRSHRIHARLDSARGTAGRALHDRAIQRQRALFRARMDSVKAELLAHPLRWLRFAPF